jgi:hypothetical protein
LELLLFFSSNFQNFNIFCPLFQKLKEIDVKFKQELPLAAIFVGGTGRNEETLKRTLYRCFLPSLVPFGPVVNLLL